MLIPSRLVSYTAGALCGLVAFLIEQSLAPQPPEVAAAVGYSVLFGGVGGLARFVGDHFSAPQGRERRTLYVVAGALALHLLYVVNVLILPGVPSLHWTSLCADALALAAVTAVATAASRFGPLRWSQSQSAARAGTAANFALLVGAALALAPHWPRDGAEPPPGAEGPNLLLIVIDSARRDHLGVYGYERPTSPSLDAFAAGARVYEQAYSPSTWTFPSVAAILGFGVTSTKRGEERPALQGNLAERGYSTAVFSDNGLVGRGSRIARGFHRLDEATGRWLPFVKRVFLGSAVRSLLTPVYQHLWDDGKVVDKAIGWAAARPGPFLLYVHLQDAHVPYRFPAIDGREWRFRKWNDPRNKDPITGEEREDVVAFYDGGLRSADAQAGRLLRAAAGWKRPFLAIVTADHGESLGESGRYMHNNSLGPELLRVPLLVGGVGVQAGRVTGPVGSQSIRGTFLAAAGAACADCTGTDLRRSEGDPVVEGGFPPNLWYRLVGREKVVLNVRTGQVRLFDPIADPEEANDLAAERPERVAELARGLGPKRLAEKFSPEEVEALKALGYVQ